MSTATTTRPRPRPDGGGGGGATVRRSVASSSSSWPSSSSSSLPLLRRSATTTLPFLLFLLFVRGGGRRNDVVVVAPPSRRVVLARPPFPAAFLVVVPPPPPPSRSSPPMRRSRSRASSRDGPRFMARGGLHGKKTRMIQSQRRKKKSKDPNAKSRKVVKTRRKNDKRDNNDGGGGMDLKKKKKKPGSSSKSTNAVVSLPSGRSNAPPWKVASAKDAQRRVESELERRRRVRAGEEPHDDDDDGSALSSSSVASDRLLSESDRSLLSWKRFRPDADVFGVSLVGSYLGRRRSPPSLGVPEIAFLGRSNVGKSSLLNELIERSVGRRGGGGGNGNGGEGTAAPKDTARVGKTPGATASVNLYALLGRTRGASSARKPMLGLADLPGFGYAKLSRDVKESVEVAAERYLGNRKELALGVLLVDARRTPSDDDRAVLAALYDMGVPLVVVATKIDKITNKNSLVERLEDVRIGLGLPNGQPLPVSSVDGRGTKELWRILMDAAEGRAEELREELEGGGGGRSSEEETGEEDDDVADDGDDDEDFAYDQGYDWIHGIRGSSSIPHDDNECYDDGVDCDGGVAEEGTDESANRSRRLAAENEARQAAESDSFRLKSLRRAARAMERRGEI